MTERPRMGLNEREGFWPSEAPIDIDAWLGPVADQVEWPGMETYNTASRSWAVDLNMGWRLTLEGFQEYYHFCAAHKDTASSAYLNNQSVFIDQYPHIRHAVPLSRVVGP